MVLSGAPVVLLLLSGVAPGVVGACFFLCFIAPVVVEVSVLLLGAMEVSVPAPLELTADPVLDWVWSVVLAFGWAGVVLVVELAELGEAIGSLGRGWDVVLDVWACARDNDARVRAAAVAPASKVLGVIVGFPDGCSPP